MKAHPKYKIDNITSESNKFADLFEERTKANLQIDRQREVHTQMMEFNTKGTCKQFHNKREQIEQYYGTNAERKYKRYYYE